MEIKIQYVSNGWIYTDAEGQVFVYKSDNEKDVEGFVDMLYHIKEDIGPSESKWSDKRVYINVAPGSDSDAWKKIEYCPLCYHDQTSFDKLCQYVLDTGVHKCELSKVTGLPEYEFDHLNRETDENGDEVVYDSMEDK